MHHSTTPRQGFTLIEMSIVMIIIALTLAGIFAGTDLIAAAKVHRQIGQIQSFNTAANTFKGKYRCIPGDCARAYDFGFGNSAADNGNGDGLVQDAALNLDNKETVNFWYQLAKAGLIEGAYNINSAPVGGIPHIPGIDSPPLAMKGIGVSGRVGGVTPVYSNIQGGVWVASHAFYLNLGMSKAQNAWFLSTTTAVDTWIGVYNAGTIFAIDNKMDDGIPNQGGVQVVDQSYQTDLRLNGTGAGTCVLTASTPWTYNVSNVNHDVNSVCSPLIEVDF